MLRKFLILLASIVLTTNVDAFNGERQGFVLNLGVGGGMNRASFAGASTSNLGFATNFVLGYAPNNQVTIGWMARSVHFSPEFSSKRVLNGVAGLGIIYYFKGEAPAGFVNGVIGYTTYGNPGYVDSDIKGEYGIGVDIGAGFEFSKNWSFGVDFYVGKTDTYGSPISAVFSINHHWY